MISIRRSLSLATLAASLAFGAASAQADVYKTPHHGGGVPLVTSNSVTANNIAAGIGNKATQGVYADQSGASKKWYGGGLTSNSTNANNIAAGIGNTANQEVMTRQSGGGGGLTLNRVDAMNLAAGEHNFANQRVFSQQR